MTLLVFACGPDQQAAEPGSGGGETPAATTSPDQDCPADPDWVSSPSEAKAAEFVANSNCSFHRWAYQNFLWLTSPDAETGESVFENFANPRDLFVAGGPGPYPGRTADAPLTMLARTGKSRTTADVEDIFQAGPGGQALIDQNGEIVFYSNHLNKVFWDFVVDNQLYDLDPLQAFPPGTDFPVGALELKASWRVAEKDGRVLIENADQRFYVVDAEIPTVTVNDQGQFVDHKDQLVPARMALVGMHVTGIVENHPEFIWATFEHVDNAPVCATDRSQPATRNNGPTGAWSFYLPGTPTNASNQFDPNDPLAVVNVCLVHPQGGGTPANMSAVQTLNTNVHNLPLASPWTGYELGGGVWTGWDPSQEIASPVPLNNGAFSPADLPATPTPRAVQLGSLNLANTTMETFTQNDNCFACHNGGMHTIFVGDNDTATDITAKNINLSHFIVNYQAKRQTDPGQ